MGTEKHQGKHDLESIFYALLYELTVFKGPSSLRTATDYATLSSFPSVLDWFDLSVMQGSFNKMAHIKIGYLSDFQRAIVNKMDPYFNGLCPFLQSLFKATFLNNLHHCSHLTHDVMIDLFNNEHERLLALEKLEEADKEKDKGQEDEISSPRKCARSECEPRRGRY
jgi:hypothetical protein